MGRKLFQLKFNLKRPKIKTCETELFFSHIIHRETCVYWLRTKNITLFFHIYKFVIQKYTHWTFVLQVCNVCIQSSKHTSSGILKILSAINCHKPSLLQMTHINQEDGTLAASLTDTLSCVSRNIWIVSQAASQIKWLNLIFLISLINSLLLDNYDHSQLTQKIPNI